MSPARRLLCLIVGVPLFGTGAYLLALELLGSGHAARVVGGSAVMLMFAGTVLLGSAVTGR